MLMAVLLTWNCGRGLVYSCYGRVHLNDVLLSGNLGVSLIHLLVNPLLEGIADNCVDHVGDIGSGQFHDFAIYQRQGFHGVLCSAFGPFQLIFYGKTFEERYRDYSDIGLFDHPTSTCTDVSHMKNGYRLVTRQVDASFWWQEAKYFALGRIFWRKGGCVDSHVLVWRLSLALAHDLVDGLRCHFLLICLN